MFGSILQAIVAFARDLLPLPRRRVEAHMYATGGSGTTADPWTGLEGKLPQGNNLVYHFEGEFLNDTLTFTGDHLQFIGDGFNKTVLRSKTGQNVIEYTTGDASFCVFRDFQVLGTGSGSGHGIWIHDTNASVAIQSMAMMRMRFVSCGGDGLRIGYPGTTTNLGAAPVYGSSFRDIETRDCGGNHLAFQSCAPGTNFDAIIYRNVAPGKFGMYFDVLAGKVTSCSGNDNLAPTVAAPTIDGGGCIRVTGLNGVSNATFENCNFESAGGNFVDLSGAGGYFQFFADTWLDNAVKRSVADRKAIKWDNVNTRVEFDRVQFNSATQWANSQPVHCVPASILMVFDSPQITAAWSDGDAASMPISQYGTTYIFGYGFVPFIKHLEVNEAAFGWNVTLANPSIVYYGTTATAYVTNFSTTNVTYTLGAHTAFQMFNAQMILGPNGDVVVSTNSPFKFLSSTVAGLPAASSAAGQYFHATDARNPGEGVGAGTGSLVFSNGTIWITVTNPGGFPAFGASGASHASGYVPDPGATAGTRKYLREDATFALPAQVYNANVTPVTVNANSTSAQNLMSFSVGAGDLNVLGRTMTSRARGVNTVQNTGTTTISVKLGSVTIISWTTASITGGATNCPWSFEIDITPASTGASGTLEVHGALTHKTTGGAGATTVYADGNTAASGAIDLTAANTLQVQVTYSANGASANSCTERQMISELK